jgi:hypothetical protein
MGKDYQVGDDFPDNLAKYVGSRVEKVGVVEQVVEKITKRQNKAILGSTKQVKVTKK